MLTVVRIVLEINITTWGLKAGISCLLNTTGRSCVVFNNCFYGVVSWEKVEAVPVVNRAVVVNQGAAEKAAATAAIIQTGPALPEILLVAVGAIILPAAASNLSLIFS